MLFSIIKWSIISLSLIFLVHHLYTFLMNTLTVPKIKDLVNKPKEQYNDLFQTMQNGMQGNSMQSNSMQGNNNNNKNIETKNMTDELSSFLNDLKTTGNTIANANANGNANISEINNNNEIIGAADQFSGNGFSAF
jgi:hypothetical protein